MSQNGKEDWLGPEPPAAAAPVVEKPAAQDWERGVLEKLALAAVAEQRRSRRWGIFFKVLMFAYLIALLALFYSPGPWGETALTTAKAHTALVKVQGVIADDTETDALTITKGLRKAFEDDKTKGVILQINSPGGSAVQSGQVYQEIRRLREKYPDIPLYAVITDVCASGGYYIASAADKIYADRASLVGSIGVIMPGFGFVDAMEKLGVERRLITAGEHKGFLDPFSPLKVEELSHVRSILDDIHQQFISAVRVGRGERLKEGDDVFSGLLWTGEQALEHGLVDALGSTDQVAREVIEAETLEDFTTERDIFERLARRVGAGVGATLLRATGAVWGPLAP